MNRIVLVPLLFILVFPGIASAQDRDGVPAPSKPFVASVPDNTTWTISLTTPAAGKLPPGVRMVSELVNTKSGSTRGIVSKWTDGSVSEVWFFNGYCIERMAGDGSIVVRQSPKGTDPRDSDFFDFGWLDSSNYVGTESTNSETCYHFKSRIKLQYQRLTLDYSADISVKTKLPVAWDVGPNHFEVTSMAERNSDEPLVLPDDLARHYNAFRRTASLANSYKNQ